MAAILLDLRRPFTLSLTSNRLLEHSAECGKSITGEGGVREVEGAEGGSPEPRTPSPITPTSKLACIH
jgi:hypothetical protein